MPKKRTLLREIAKQVLVQGQAIGYVKVWSETVRLAWRDQLDMLAGRSVLLIAPHPDDDIFGVGGTLALLAEMGCRITVLYLTDGVGGTADSTIDHALKTVRREEALEALSVIDPNAATIFWDEPDGRLAATPKLASGIAEVVQSTQPSAIFYPNLLESHMDHAVVTPMLVNALKTTRFSGLLWGYEIWTPAPVNITIDITGVIDRKRAAMECHRSQLASRPYRTLVEGLNRYRAGVESIDGFAESFLVTTALQLEQLYKLKQRAATVLLEQPQTSTQMLHEI